MAGSKYYAVVVMVVLALLHAPFILSDPDTEVSVSSRDAWTDEGLNTVQVRNFVNHGKLSMDECDNLIKTPYFGFVLVPFYFLFGTHIWVGRLLVLGFVLLVLFLFLRRPETRLFGTVLAIIGLLQFHVFHYSHYSMAEMMAISWILLGIYLLWHSAQQSRWLVLVASTACFSLSYCSKVTFAYAIIIPFATSYLQFISDRIHDRQPVPSLWKIWGIQGLVTGFFAAAFYIKWYLPNKAVFDMVKANQGQGRYDIGDAWNRFQFNLDEFILVDGITPFIVLVPIALIGLWRKDLDSGKRILFFALLSWLAVELHHALLINPPTRYLLPLFFACLALVAFAMAEAAYSGVRKTMVWVALLIFGGYNLSHYAESVSRRTFQIRDVQQYLAQFELKDETVLGVWGATLASEEDVHSIPIWSDFNVKDDPIGTYRPRIIFAEFNEADSGEAFRLKGIDLAAVSDSVRQFNLWRYDVNLHWVKQP